MRTIIVKIELITTHKCKCQYSHCSDNPVECLITLFGNDIDSTFLNFNDDFFPGWRGRTRDVAIEWAHWRERKVQSIPCCNCSVPAFYGLPIENTSVGVSGLKIVFLQMPVGWRRSVEDKRISWLRKLLLTNCKNVYSNLLQKMMYSRYPWCFLTCGDFVFMESWIMYTNCSVSGLAKPLLYRIHRCSTRKSLWYVR